MESYEAPTCPYCQVDLRGLGQLPVRVGGTTSGWHFFLGEQIKPLDLYRCEKCGRLEFYDYDFSLPES